MSTGKVVTTALMGLAGLACLAGAVAAGVVDGDLSGLGRLGLVLGLALSGVGLLALVLGRMLSTPEVVVSGGSARVPVERGREVAFVCGVLVFCLAGVWSVVTGLSGESVELRRGGTAPPWVVLLFGIFVLGSFGGGLVAHLTARARAEGGVRITSDAVHVRGLLRTKTCSWEGLSSVAVEEQSAVRAFWVKQRYIALRHGADRETCSANLYACDAYQLADLLDQARDEVWRQDLLSRPDGAHDLEEVLGRDREASREAVTASSS